MRHVVRISITLLWLLAAWGQVHAGEQETPIPNPCSGASSLFAVLNRPTISDSTCVVAQGQYVLEAGFQHTDLRGPGGKADNYPQATIRIGLPGRNEFVFLAPDYNRLDTRAAPGSPAQETAGYSATTLGLKHELGYTRYWVGAVEALFTLPTGDSTFGSRGLGVAVNGVAAYALSEQVGFSLQLGVSSQTDPAAAGGRRFTSLISNFVATWQPAERLQFYAEIYGQSSTGPGRGAGYNGDGGVQYLITPSLEVDVEGGVRLIGDLGGFTHYFGAGMGLRF